MSDKGSARAIGGLSLLYVLVVLCFDVCLYEIGRHWHYPVLSLCFSSGICAVFYTVLWFVVERRTARPRIAATLTSRTPSTQTEAPTTWKWEFPAPSTAQPADNNLLKVNMAPILLTSGPSPPSSTSNYSKKGTVELWWDKHKHFIACGVLLASGGICSLFSTPLVSYQWQIFSYEFILPLTFFMSEYTLQKASVWERRGMLIMMCGGLINGIPIVLTTSFSAWCAMFAAISIIAASLNVYQGFLYQQHHQLVETVAWSNIYFFITTLLIAPLYAFAGIQQDIHSFSDLFRVQKQGVVCLQSSESPCFPYSWVYAASFVLLFALYLASCFCLFPLILYMYCVLQTKLTFDESPNYQASLNSLALPCMAMVYQIKLHASHVEMIYPVLSMAVLIVGLVVCKLPNNNNLFNKATRF